MRIDFNNNTLIVTLYDDNNLWKLLKAITEIENLLGSQIALCVVLSAGIVSGKAGSHPGYGSPTGGSAYRTE